MQITRPCLRPLAPEILQVGPRSPCLKMPSRRFWMWKLFEGRDWQTMALGLIRLTVYFGTVLQLRMDFTFFKDFKESKENFIMNTIIWNSNSSINKQCLLEPNYTYMFIYVHYGFHRTEWLWPWHFGSQSLTYVLSGLLQKSGSLIVGCKLPRINYTC